MPFRNVPGSFGLRPSINAGAAQYLLGQLRKGKATSSQQAAKPLIEVSQAIRREGVIGGFSDGASYAISLGLLNGDLFKGVMAFSLMTSSIQLQ